MVEGKKRVFMPKVETKLTRQDFKRVDDLAKVEGKTKSEVVREAVLWLANMNLIESITNPLGVSL